MLRRKSPQRLAFANVDHLVFAGLYRLAPGVLDALEILKPQTVIAGTALGLRAYWGWKSPPRGGRPNIAHGYSPAHTRYERVANPVLGSNAVIHGELLKLGIDVGQTTVAKYMVRRRQLRSPRLENLFVQSCRRYRVDGFIRST
jgi:hypothetical protein